MIAGRSLALSAVVVTAFAAGMANDGHASREPLAIHGYQVLAADFHLHPYPLSSSVLPPWALVLQARAAGLDAIAVTPHDHLWPAKVARWFSTMIDGPIVLAGEEVEGDGFDLLVVGIERAIAGRQAAASIIAASHAQGGIAIAAHPTGKYGRGYDAEALARLDGTEIVHPLGTDRPEVARELVAFSRRTEAAVVNDSDFHMGRFGTSRTYVFSRERSARGILEAMRLRRTVVYDGEQAYGDPDLIAAAATDGRLPRLAQDSGSVRFWSLRSALGIACMIALVLFGLRTQP